MIETSDSEIVSTRQRRIAQLAKQMPEKGLTSLNQHLDLAWLREAYASLSKQTMWSGVSCLLEVDIRKFFDTLDHAHLRAFLQQRIRDGVVLRLIGKWLNAGVMEAGAVTHPEAGSPQGGVVSPVLANVYLHYVLDQWFVREVQPRLKGRAYVVRYADDFVIGFTEDEDARRVMAVLPKRFGKYGLTIHPDKTRLVPFRKPQGERKGPDSGGPGTFDFLGFTHFWARSRKGNWVLMRKTAASRFTRAVRTIAQWCRSHRHDPIAEQHTVLCQKLHGHAGYYGITGNSPALARFYHEVLKVWRKWLARRRRAWRASWNWFHQLLARHPLPYLRVIHSLYRRVAKG